MSGTELDRARDDAQFELNCALEFSDYERAERMHRIKDALTALRPEPVADERYRIEHDGFVGTKIGEYQRLDGKRGVVLQQDGTNIVHVYGEKWLVPALAAHPAESRAEVLEEAAKVAEAFSVSQHVAHSIKTGVFPEQSDIREAIADAIRKLAGGGQ